MDADRKKLERIRDQLKCSLNMGGLKGSAEWVVAELEALLAAPVSPGMHTVPFAPSPAQWGGLARDIVWWMRAYPSRHHTPATLIEHLTNLGREIPHWLGDEAEMRTNNHVISKGAVATLIYKAMLSDAGKPSEEDDL